MNMHKRLARTLPLGLLCAAIAVQADTMTVKVPLTVKSMRSEVSHVRVLCQLLYNDASGQRRARHGQSPFLALDKFGNLSQEIRLAIDTSGVSGDRVHAPDSTVVCAASLYKNSPSDLGEGLIDSTLLIQPNHTHPDVNRATLLNDAQSTLLVRKENWAPDEPPSLDLFSQDPNLELTTPAATKLRIR